MTSKNFTNIWLYNSNNTDAQKWYPVKNSDNTYTFYTIDGTVMDIYAGSTANNTNVNIYESNSTKAQKYYLKDVSTFSPANLDTNTTYYILSSINKNKALDVYAASKADSANVDIYDFNKTGAQKFKFRKNNDSTYTILNENSNKAIHITGNASNDGANVVQYAPNNSNAQKWYVFKNSDNTVTFISKETGKALNLNNGNTTNFSNINIWSWNENVAQKWILSDTITITLNKTSLVLNLLDNSTETLKASSPSSDSIKWTSSDSNIAEVDPQTGKVTGKSIGTCTITAQIGDKKASCNVEVISIKFAENQSNRIIVGEKGQKIIATDTIEDIAIIESSENEELVGSSIEVASKAKVSEIEYSIKEGNKDIISLNKNTGEVETNYPGKIVIEAKNKNSKTGVTKEFYSVADYISGDICKSPLKKVSVLHDVKDTQMQGLDISASECVFYSTIKKYSENSNEVLLVKNDKERSSMSFYNFGHGSGFDTEMIKHSSEIYKYALWTESVGAGTGTSASSSNYAISRINYIADANYNTYNVAANKVTVKSSNRPTITLNNPDVSKYSRINEFTDQNGKSFNKNENYVYYNPQTKQYMQNIKVAVDEKNQKILLYHNRNFYIYTFEQLDSLTTETFEIETNSTYYINNQAYNNAVVTLQAKNLFNLTPIKFSTNQSIVKDGKTLNALEYSWQGIALDGDYIYLIEGHRPSGVNSYDLSIKEDGTPLVDGRAFINVYTTKDGANKLIDKYELEEFDPNNQKSKDLENNFSKGAGFKYKMEVEGIKVITKDKTGEKTLYIGITGLSSNDNQHNSIGVFKYNLFQDIN